MTIIDNSQWILPAHLKLPKGKTLAVVVLDGWGEQVGDEYNAIHVAHTPTMDSLRDVSINSFLSPPSSFYLPKIDANVKSRASLELFSFFLILLIVI